MSDDQIEREFLLWWLATKVDVDDPNLTRANKIIASANAKVNDWQAARYIARAAFRAGVRLHEEVPV